MKRIPFLLIFLPAFLPSFSRALTLDIPAKVSLKAASFSDLPYKSRTNDQSYFLENSEIGFIVKNISLEKTLSSSMDIGIKFLSYGSGSSTNSINSQQFRDALQRYPQNNGTPFVNNAYVKIHNFMDKPITATFGRQHFTLGRGITLSDDNLGFPGILMEFNRPFGTGFKTDIFAFRIWDKTRMVKIAGVNVNLPTDEGLWQVYAFGDYDKVPQTLNSISVKSRMKKFFGLRYFTEKNRISFDGEFIVQKGSEKKLAGGELDYSAYAFLVSGRWKQKLPVIGKTTARVSYGKSSGNSVQPAAMREEKNFSPTFGHKYDGFERSGFGEIAGASIYDILPSSGTPSGLPEGMSGMRITNLAFDIPFGKSIFTVDYTLFRTMENYAGGSKNIGSELDFILTRNAGESLKIKAVYGTFKPKWEDNMKTVKLISLGINAKF